MNEQCQPAQTPPSTATWRFRSRVAGRFAAAYRVLQLLFLRLCYRHLMRLTHYFGWHYAPLQGPIMPDGDMYRWCHWCGMRDTIPNPNRMRAELIARASSPSAAGERKESK